MINRRYFQFIFLFFCVFHSIGNGQTKHSFQDDSSKTALNIHEMNSQYGIDSIGLACYDTKVIAMLVYGGMDSTNFSTKEINRGRSYYYLDYLGDLHLLEERYPLLHTLITDKDIIMGCCATEFKSFILTLSPRGNRVQETFFVMINASAKRKKVQEFTDYLNRNYSDTIVPPADSILMVQIVVSHVGSRVHTELLHGEKELFMILSLDRTKSVRNTLYFNVFFTPTSATDAIIEVLWICMSVSSRTELLLCHQPE